MQQIYEQNFLLFEIKTEQQTKNRWIFPLQRSEISQTNRNRIYWTRSLSRLLNKFVISLFMIFSLYQNLFIKMMRFLEFGKRKNYYKSSLFDTILSMMSQSIKTELTADSGQEYTESYFNFLFVNTQSGSMAGKELAYSKPEDLTFRHGYKLTSFFIVDMYSESQRTMGFRNANMLALEGENVRVIICGGDGTIEWVLFQALAHDLDFQRVVFGVLPIGTGNDFANSIGWKGFKFSGYLSELRSLAIKLSESRLGTYDIWQATINCSCQGKISQIKNGKEVTLVQKKLRRNFTNYLGIGTDARISYIAQKINAHSVSMKKVAYGLAGIFSFFLQWGSLAKKLVIRQKENSIKYNSLEEVKTLTSMEQFSEYANLDDGRYQKIKIEKSDQCLVFLNSTSSMELKGIWETPYETSAKIFGQGQYQLKKYQKQTVNDEMIEVISYRNEISLMLERSIHMAKRVAQGKGPFKIDFKETKKQSSNYVHINGEPYRIQGLESILIEPSPCFPHSKIKVLVNRQ